MRIQHNIMAMSAYRNYTNNVSAMKANLEKLSSGYKINRAGDDAAGLAISEKMRAQITGLETAQKNAKDGISLVQTAEGALTEVHDMLNRMVELATQSANGTYSDDTDREQLQKELDQLRQEIDRIIDAVLAAGEDPVANTGVKTILDGGDNGSRATKFDVDFTGLAASAGTGGTGGTGGGGTSTFEPDQNGVNGVTVNVNATAAGDGTVSIEVTSAATDKAASATGSDDLTGITFSGKASDGSAANGYKIEIKTTGNSGDEGATIDDTTKTITLNLAQDGGDGSGSYNATALETLLQSATDGNGGTYSGNLDLGGMTVGGTGTIDASGAAATVGDVTLAGGETTGDKVVTLSSAAGTYTEAVGSWSGDVTITGDNGVAVTIDTTTVTGALTQSTLGTVSTTNNGGGGGADSQVSFKIGNTTLATDVTVTGTADAKAIATAIFGALNDADGNTDGTQVAINGVNYTVTDGGNGKLTFELIDDPSATNIKGNYDWDVSMKDATGTFTGNHTAGTTVTQQGQVGAANSKANTVFNMTTADLKDGTKITIDGVTVTLAVGADSSVATKDENGNAAAGVIDLTSLDPTKDGGLDSSDLNAALGKISEGFKTGTTNFIVGVNDKSNGDANIGLTVHKKDSSTKTYDTKEKLAEVFSIETPGTGKALTLQIGDTAAEYNQLKVDIKACDSASLGLADIDISKQGNAQDAIDAIKAAINYVSDVRGTLGATQNRLDHTINNLSVMTENIQDAESTIRDVDVAEEMMAYTKNNILIQASQAMLAQANQVPQGVLQLLQ